MAEDVNWKNIFEFLSTHLLSQEPFSKSDMGAVTNWKGTTFPTHFSKRLKQFLVKSNGDYYRVGEAFRKFAGNWEQFNRQVVTQVRKVAEDYASFAYDAVMIFEFFLPLTHEGTLRKTLDALFYKDTVLNRLKSVADEDLYIRFPRDSEEEEKAYLERLCLWISERFGGYSITHVSGRFKAKPLQSIDEAAELQRTGGRYLVDETTAVARFIFPCGHEKNQSILETTQGLNLSSLGEKNSALSAESEAETIRWVFNCLFVQSIVQAVNGEDEIWMIESGMRNALHVWRISE